MNSARNTLHPSLIAIQDKQVAQELAAIAKHGKLIERRRVIFAARTRAMKAIMQLGFNQEQATQAVTDAADVVELHMLAKEN